MIAKRDETMVAWGTMPAAVQLPEQSPRRSPRDTLAEWARLQPARARGQEAQHDAQSAAGLHRGNSRQRRHVVRGDRRLT